MNKTALLSVSLALALVGLTACGKKEQPPPPPPAPVAVPAGLSVSAVTLGSAIGADKKVTKAGDSFGPKDTIYLVVETQGSGTAHLKARWTYHKGDKSADVKEEALTIQAAGPAVNELHVSKPDGWPVGDYQVAVTLDDKPVETRKYSVK